MGSRGPFSGRSAAPRRGNDWVSDQNGFYQKTNGFYSERNDWVSEQNAFYKKTNAFYLETNYRVSEQNAFYSERN
jgi:hypothetical protein